MTGPHWKARTNELRANAAHAEIDVASAGGRIAEFLRQWAMMRDKSDDIYGVHADVNVDMAELKGSDLRQLLIELAELRADNERWRIKFEASQLVAGKAIRERAEAIATVERQAARIMALGHDITDAKRMHGNAVERGIEWMDHVIENASKGDWDQLIEQVGDDLNCCDAVDDESIARWAKAKTRAARDTTVVAAAERLTTEAQQGMWNSSITCDLIVRALLGLDPKTPRDIVIDVLESMDERGTVLDVVPLTHDGIRSDKAIRPRA